MDHLLSQALSQYLRQHNTMTLATCGTLGPAAAGLFYVNDSDLNLYFISEEKALHIVNLARDPRVAVTIQEDYRDWREIQGVQLRGVAQSVPAGLEMARITGLYLRKFPALRHFFGGDARHGERLREKIMLSRFHVVKPEWVRWIDNQQGFGYRREMVLGADPGVSG